MGGVSSRQGSFAIGKQSALGTPAASPTHRWFMSGAPSLQLNRGRAQFAMTDNSRSPGDWYTSGWSVGGSVPLYAHPEGMSVLFAGVLGTVGTTGVGPYVHTITPGTDVPYFTMWRMTGGGTILEKFTDCKINSLSLEGGAGSPLTVAIDIIGIDSIFLASDPVLAALTDQPMLYMEGENLLKFDTVAQSLHQFSLEINNNLDGYQSDGYKFEEIDPGGIEINFSANARFNSPTAFPKYREWLYGSDAGTAITPTVGIHPVDFKFIRSGSSDFQILMPEVSYSAIPIQSDPSGDPIEIALAMAVERPASGSIVSAVVKDARATPYT